MQHACHSLSRTYHGASGKAPPVNRVLRARSALLLSKGRADDALANQMLLLRLTRQWRREPLIIGYLVTAVCELGAMEGVNQVLQAGPVSPAARQALDAELALHDTMEGYNRALRSERAYSLSSIREIPGSGFWLTRGFSNELSRGSSISTIGTWPRFASVAEWLPTRACAASEVSDPICTVP